MLKSRFGLLRILRSGSIGRDKTFRTCAIDIMRSMKEVMMCGCGTVRLRLLSFAVLLSVVQLWRILYFIDSRCFPVGIRVTCELLDLVVWVAQISNIELSKRLQRSNVRKWAFSWN